MQRGLQRTTDIIGIVRRKVVALQAKGTDPELAAKVNLTIGIQDGVTGAANRIVGHRHAVVRRELLDRAVEGSKRSDRSRGLQATARPAMEGQTGARHVLRRRYIPATVHGHSSSQRQQQ